eukprot:g11601.t1
MGQFITCGIKQKVPPVLHKEWRMENHYSGNQYYYKQFANGAVGPSTWEQPAELGTRKRNMWGEDSMVNVKFIVGEDENGEEKTPYYVYLKRDTPALLCIECVDFYKKNQDAIDKLKVDVLKNPLEFLGVYEAYELLATLYK